MMELENRHVKEPSRQEERILVEVIAPFIASMHIGIEKSMTRLINIDKNGSAIVRIDQGRH
jgi:hypothetical protein